MRSLGFALKRIKAEAKDIPAANRRIFHTKLDREVYGGKHVGKLWLDLSDFGSSKAKWLTVIDDPARSKRPSLRSSPTETNSILQCGIGNIFWFEDLIWLYAM